MNRYLTITILSGIIIVGFIYSIFYVPAVSNFFSGLIPPKVEYSEYNAQTELIDNLEISETLPNLEIRSSDNFKSIIFGDLNLKVNSEYKLSESSERVNLKIDENNFIEGYYFSLISEPRKDIDISLYQNELYKNSYKLAKKSIISDEFVSTVFNTTIGSVVEDSIKGETVKYTAVDNMLYSSPDLSGFYFTSEKENYYKFLILSPTKLYIFNVKNEKENVLKMKKTFYNLSINK